MEEARHRRLAMHSLALDLYDRHRLRPASGHEPKQLSASWTVGTNVAGRC